MSFKAAAKSGPLPPNLSPKCRTGKEVAMPAAAATFGPNSAIEGGVCKRTKVSMKPSKPHKPECLWDAAALAFALNS